MWWMKQSAAARKAVTRSDTESLFSALQGFEKFVGDKKSAKIWGNGASFDNVILANAYKKLSMDMPWHYWNDRCYRTVKNLLGKNIEVEKVGTAHNALDDAKTQAMHLCKIMTAVQA
jgi:exodeoxyribonuclease VIII